MEQSNSLCTATQLFTPLGDYDPALCLQLLWMIRIIHFANVFLLHILSQQWKSVRYIISSAQPLPRGSTIYIWPTRPLRKWGGSRVSSFKSPFSTKQIILRRGQDVVATPGTTTLIHTPPSTSRNRCWRFKKWRSGGRRLGGKWHFKWDCTFSEWMGGVYFKLWFAM